MIYSFLQQSPSGYPLFKLNFSPSWPPCGYTTIYDANPNLHGWELLVEINKELKSAMKALQNSTIVKDINSLFDRAASLPINSGKVLLTSQRIPKRSNGSTVHIGGVKITISKRKMSISTEYSIDYRCNGTCALWVPFPLHNISSFAIDDTSLKLIINKNITFDLLN